MYQNLIINAMTPELINMLFNRSGRYPDNDEDFVTVIRDAGINLEEQKRVADRRTKRIQAPSGKTEKGSPSGKTEKGSTSGKTEKGSLWSGKTIKGSTQSGKTEKGTQDAVPTEGQKAGSARKKRGRKESDDGDTRLWKGAEAFDGIPHDEVEAHKAAGNCCYRCGREGHKSYECYAYRTKKGTELPVHPSKVTESANATKKREKQPAEKKPKIAAVTDHDAAARQARIWELESEEDF
jgi:hypothetical protein